jgi:hypothetical protein
MAATGDAFTMLGIVDTLEKLEVARVLSRSQSPRPVPEITAEIGLPQPAIEEAIAGLRDSRVVIADVTGYRLDPQGPHAAGIAALVKLYDDDRVRVLHLLTQNALARIRAGAARTFADAFVLRPKKKGDGDG